MIRIIKLTMFILLISLFLAMTQGSAYRCERINAVYPFMSYVCPTE
jgi:hypothetical protein